MLNLHACESKHSCEGTDFGREALFGADIPALVVLCTGWLRGYGEARNACGEADASFQEAAAIWETLDGEHDASGDDNECENCGAIILPLWSGGN